MDEGLAKLRQENEKLKAKMWRILQQHRGAKQAIQVPELTLEIGLELTSHNERIVRRLKRELVDDGLLIASSCGKFPGYFIPVTSEEMEESLKNYEARFKSLAVLIAKLKGAAALRGLLRQLRLDLKGNL